jgi:5-methylcytosine-specific restriction endonuclease McrA
MSGPSGKHVRCVYCSNPTYGARFCSPLCAELHAWERRKPPIRIRDCDQCGQPFPALNHLTRTHCSPACKRAHRAAQARTRPRPYIPDKAKHWYETRRLKRLAAELAAWAPRPMRLALPAGPGPQCAYCCGPRPTRRSRYCCESCAQQAKLEMDRQYHGCAPTVERIATCLRCEATFITTVPTKVYCTEACAAAEHRDRAKRRRRARKANAKTEVIGLFSLARRDGWRCHICKRNVTRKTWSMDHLVPLSYGGDHTWDNVALAHHRCNSKRGAHGQAQLRLAA